MKYLFVILTLLIFSTTAQASCLSDVVFEYQSKNGGGLNNPLLPYQGSNYLLPLSVNIQTANDRIFDLYALQSDVLECGYVASLHSVSHLYIDANATETLNQGYANIVVRIEEAQSQNFPSDFSFISQHILDQNFLRGISVGDLFEVYGKYNTAEGLTEWSFNFGKIREECPIIWERYSALVKPSITILQFGEEQMRLEVDNLTIERYFVDDNPHIIVATNSNRDICKFTIAGHLENLP